MLGMGGGLGNIMRATGMVAALSRSAPVAQLGIWLAVLLASAIKIAQAW